MSALLGTSTEFVRILAKGGIEIVGGDACAGIREAAGKLVTFTPFPLAERRGWNGSSFALGSGEVLHPKGQAAPTAIFRAESHRFARSGSLADWQEHVAAPLAGQLLPSFVLMTAFAAPLLDLIAWNGNPGFEITGETSKGKTTILRLAASVIGVGHHSPRGQYIYTGRVTPNGIEGVMRQYAHSLLVIDDLSQFAGPKSGKGRAGELRDLVMTLNEGKSKLRHDDHDQDATAFVVLTSSNEPLSSQLDAGRELVNDAVRARLLTLPADGEYGVFEFVPDGYGSSGEFARALTQAAERNYGQAIGPYLARLVQDRADDEVTLRKRIEGYIEWFRRDVGVDRNDGVALRVVDAFGLVYAAGRLARRYGILPKALEYKKAVRACYRHHLASVQQRPFNDRLIALARRPGVIDLDKGYPDLTDEQLAEVPAFLRTNQAGEREIVLRQQQLKRAFPDWTAIATTEEVQLSLAKHRNRRGSQCKIRAGKPKERVYIFRLDAAGI